MFAGYCILFAAILVVVYLFCALIGGGIMAYILGFLLLVAVLAALATIVTKLRELEEKLDKLLGRGEEGDGHE